MATLNQIFLAALDEAYDRIEALSYGLDMGNAAFDEVPPDAFARVYTRHAALNFLHATKSLEDWSKGDRYLKFWILAELHAGGHKVVFGTLSNARFML